MKFFKRQEPEELVKKYFLFLVEEYGLTYTTYCYKSEKIRVVLEIGHKTPRISIYRIEEPEFTSLIFERIIQYFEGKVEIDELVIDF